MAIDRPVRSGGQLDDDRSGPFDIEREEAVLARVVDRSVPIQPQRSGGGGRGGDGVDPAATDDRGSRAPNGAAWGEVPEAANGAAASPGPGLDEGTDATYPAPVEGVAPLTADPASALPMDAPADAGTAVATAADPATVVAPVADWAPAPAQRRPLPFSMARRGFEPSEVEAYIAQQEDALVVAVERADTAERQLAEALAQLGAARERIGALEEQLRAEPPASITALGERVADILDTAWRAAEDLRADAATAADRAHAEADEIRRAAEAEARAAAAEIVAEAERHRRAVLEELAARRAEHDAEVARLASERQAAVAELERLHGVLQRVLAPTQAAAGSPSAGEAAGHSPG